MHLEETADAEREQQMARIFAAGLLRVHPEATAFSGLSRTTLYTLMDSGRLVYVKLGKSRRILKVALQRLLAANLIQKSDEVCDRYRGRMPVQKNGRTPE